MEFITGKTNTRIPILGDLMGGELFRFTENTEAIFMKGNWGVCDYTNMDDGEYTKCGDVISPIVRVEITFVDDYGTVTFKDKE